MLCLWSNLMRHKFPWTLCIVWGAVSVWLTFPTVFVAWWSLVKLGQTITTWGFSQVHSDKWITTVVNPSFQRIETGKKRRMNEQKWKFRSISLVKVDKFQMCKKFCSLFNENIVSLFSRGGPVCPLAVQVNSVEAIIDDECPWRGWRFLQFGSI